MLGRKYNRNDLLKQYRDLSLQAGKMLSIAAFRRIALCNSKHTFETHFKNKKILEQMVLEQYPELEQLNVSVAVTEDQVIASRLKFHGQMITKENQKVITALSNLDYIEQFSDKIFSGIIKAKPYQGSKITNRVLNLVLSDLHFGADIDGEETGSTQFGKLEEARRLAKVISETCNFKRVYRKETTLNVFLLGDIIQGMLGHDPRDGAQLAEQFCRAIHLLGQAIGLLSTNFKEITIYCSSGNHGRNIGRHHGRAVHSKYDSYETMLYYSLMKACNGLKNVHFKIPKTLHVIGEALGHKIYAWHGDTGISTGSVGKAINIQNIEKAVNRINASLQDTEEFKVFLCGHLHTGTISFLHNGTALVVNGGLPPADSFSLSIGNPESNSGQMLFESTKDYALGDIRYIRVNDHDDKNKALDQVIKAWISYDK